MYLPSRAACIDWGARLKLSHKRILTGLLRRKSPKVPYVFLDVPYSSSGRVETLSWHRRRQPWLASLGGRRRRSNGRSRKAANHLKWSWLRLVLASQLVESSSSPLLSLLLTAFFFLVLPQFQWSSGGNKELRNTSSVEVAAAFSFSSPP